MVLRGKILLFLHVSAQIMCFSTDSIRFWPFLFKTKKCNRKIKVGMFILPWDFFIRLFQCLQLIFTVFVLVILRQQNIKILLLQDYKNDTWSKPKNMAWLWSLQKNPPISALLFISLHFSYKKVGEKKRVGICSTSSYFTVVQFGKVKHKIFLFLYLFSFRKIKMTSC